MLPLRCKTLYMRYSCDTLLTLLNIPYTHTKSVRVCKTLFVVAASTHIYIWWLCYCVWHFLLSKTIFMNVYTICCIETTMSPIHVRIGICM